jgi:hypothetical protein
MFTVTSMNCISFDCTQKPLFDESFVSQTQILPRTPRERYIPPKGAKLKRKWNFATSIFRTYKKDTEKLLEDTFENDFKLGRYTGFIKDSKDFKKTKDHLKRNYRSIKQVYKYFSSYSGVSSALN